MQKLKIGLNLLYLRPGRVGGSETYVRSILEELLKKDSLEIHLFGSTETIDSFSEQENLKLVSVSSKGFSQTGRLWDENVRLSQLVTGVDVLWSPANFIAPGLPSRIPQVATIHDLQHLWFPENFSAVQRMVREILFRLTFWKSTAWIAISDFTRRDVLARYGVAPGKSHSVLHGADFPEKPEKEEVKRILEKYKLDCPFFLYPATLSSHKGHSFLIDCFAKVVEQSPAPKPKLLFTGQQVGQWDHCKDQIRKLGVEKYIDHLGYIPRTDVTTLMTAAKALLFGSRFEGFGLPILEAMSLGTPVLASRNTAIPEVAGKGAWLLDTNDVEGWTEAILQIAKDDNLANQWIQKGYENNKRFSWQKCASETLSILAAASKHPHRKEIE
jgi:glycosyltransferase involved in cell wall biosynthesis